jgi:hypothetical protein
MNIMDFLKVFFIEMVKALPLFFVFRSLMGAWQSNDTGKRSRDSVDVNRSIFYMQVAIFFLIVWMIFNLR